MPKDNDHIAENMTDIVRIMNAKGDTGEIQSIIAQNESVQKEGNQENNNNEPQS